MIGIRKKTLQFGWIEDFENMNLPIDEPHQKTLSVVKPTEVAYNLVRKFNL